MIAAIRGATTVENDTPEEIQAATAELVTRLVEKNDIVEDDVISIFLSVTGDLHSASPARTIRLHLGWSQTPIMSAVEPDIEGLPKRCIRILIQLQTGKSRSELHHPYLRGASVLRPDLNR